MGSADAEVSGATTDVLLESAHFDRVGVLRTSRRLGLETEASIRFGRGADPEAPAPAADRTARFMAEWAGGTVLAGAIDVGEAPERHSVSVRAERATLIVTTNLPFSEWTQVFPNPRLCKALLDRVTDRAHIIETGTESYRFRRTVEGRQKKKAS